MKIKFEAELEEAIQFEVEIKETSMTYSEHLLVIINNAREYPNEFLDVHNNSRNSVFVTCPNNKSSVEAMRDFLEWHGEILEERRVLVCKPEYVFTKQSSEYLDKVFECDDAPWEIVTLAPGDLY